MNTITSTKFGVLLTLLLSICLLLTGCDTHTDKGQGRQVIVFAAASTTNAIGDIAARFTEQTGITVVTNFAASSTLAQQIETGADTDIFISADQKWADYLRERQFCQTRATIVGNRIVIIVPTESTLSADSADVLLNADIKNIAMGDPAAVPAGKYGKEAIEKLGLWEKVKDKVTAAKDVRSALAYVETQAAEAGIVYSTDAAISSKVKVIFLFPQAATAKPISYPAMTLKSAVNKDAAEAFFNFLKTDTAKDIFKRYGFITD